MADKIVVMSFTIEEQTEIERMAVDEDKGASLEFVKKLDDEFKKRERAHCKPVFDWTPNKKVSPSEIEK